MNKFHLYYALISSLCYLFASVVFFGLYKSVHGGIWAAFAGCIAGICFHLYKLYLDNKLQSFLSVRALDYVVTISFIICLVGFSFSLWYIFVFIYWKIPLIQHKNPLIFSCVFSFLTGKWGWHLYRASKKCVNEYVFSNYSPLIQNI